MGVLGNGKCNQSRQIGEGSAQVAVTRERRESGS
jgi:hypothetical protein